MKSGHFHFLEIAARVGGAGTDKLVEMASGVNPWTEWARLEVAHLRGLPYQLPQVRHDYAGLMVSLGAARTSRHLGYADPKSCIG